MRELACTLLASACALAVANAHSQGFPAKPMRFTVYEKAIKLAGLKAE